MAELRQQYAQIAGEAQKGLRAAGGQTPAAKLLRLGNCMTHLLQDHAESLSGESGAHCDPRISDG